jgi:hypothetical protein
MTFEILHRPFVFLGGGSIVEGAQIPPLAGSWVGLA